LPFAAFWSQPLAHEKEPSSSSQNSPERHGLLYILFSFFGFLFGHSFSRSRSQQHAGSIGDNYEGEGQNRQPSPEIKIRAELYTPESIERQKAANDNRNYRVQRLLTIGTWLTFLAAAIYAGISLKIWLEMQEQTRIQRNLFINSERAWVGQSGPIWLEFFTGNDKRLASRTHITLENFGRSPALGVVAMANVVEHDDLAHSAEMTCKFARAEAGFKVPGMFVGKSDIQHSGQTIFPQQKWQVEVIDSPINLRATVLYAIGCVIYRDDVTDGIWWTRFCQETNPFRLASTYKAGEPLGTCNVYNETGKYDRDK